MAGKRVEDEVMWEREVPQRKAKLGETSEYRVGAAKSSLAPCWPIQGRSREEENK